ncbi:hypothetical protein [Amycolatopsis minnesotensis]|uniref:Uncharacterized protein n=1 Tax=Amycolatopsis minnesotensis TaxID=337894 RepID=A0ABN2Q0X0_9PSEU
MSTPDRAAASEELLKREMAVLTAEFATERALESLRQAVKVGRTAEIVTWANNAVEAVMEVADLVTIPDEGTSTFATVRDSVINRLDSMTSANGANDAEGVLSRGELVADAVTNLASLLKETGS